MSARSSEVTPRGSYTGLIVVLAVLAGVALWFINHNALRYTAYDAGT